MQNSVAKKIFAVGIAASTLFMGLAPFAAQAAAHPVGTNVLSSDGTVWMIMPDGTRRAYTSGGAFLSYGFNSFATVVPANADDLALPVGASYIPPQDGKVICSDRGADKGTCYFITGSQKAGFVSQAVFLGLGYSFARGTSGDVSFLPTTTNIDNVTAAHRPGTLIHFRNSAGNDTVYLVGATGLLGVPDINTFQSWGYSWGDVIAANGSDMALPMTSGVMAVRTMGLLSPVVCTSNCGGNVISGSVTASLAADNPAPQTIAVNGVASASSTVVTLAKFAFSGSGTVTQLQVKRIGVSPDSILNNVYLYNGGTRLTDSASVGGSSVVTFSNPNGLFTVSGNTTISVVAEIAGNSSAGQTVGVQLISFTVANSAAASVAISGNTFTTATASDLAYAQFGAVTPSGSSFDPSNDIVVFQSNVTVNQRDMTMSRFIIRNIGSAQAGDINNFRLQVDGNQVAQSQTMDANGYVYFSFTPVTLKAGTRQIKILANVIGGSSRNFQFQVRNRADVDFMDTQYNTSVSAANTFPVGSGSSNSINSGSLTIQRATDSPSGNVTDGTSNFRLAKFTATAYGEAMKIETLTVAATSSRIAVGSLRNGKVLINGVQYGSTATLASSTGSSYTGGGTTFTLNYTVQPGVPTTIEIYADMYDNDNSNSLSNNDTVTAVILAGSSNIQRLVSLGYTSAPSGPILGNSITDATGSVSLSKDATYGTQTVPLPQTAMKLGDFNLVGSNSEDVNISTININAANGASTSLNTLTNVQVKINGNMFGTIKGTVATTSTSTYSGSYTLAKNSTVAVEVWGDMSTPVAAYGSDTFHMDMNVQGTALSSSAAVSSSATGQTVNFGSATITAAQDPSTPAAAITAGNQTKTAAAFKWTTTNDQFTITDVTVSLANYTTVQNIVLKDGATVLGTLPGNASSTFSNLSILVPANSVKVLTVDLQLGSVGVGAGSTGENVKVILHSYKAAPSSTGAYTTTTSGVGGNNLYVYKSIPTITTVTLPTSVLSAGTATLAKFQISSGGTGTIGWQTITFTVATSTNVLVTSLQLWDADSNSQITGAASTSYTSSGLLSTFNAQAEQDISGAKNYVLKGTVGGTLASGAYVSTYIAQPSSFAAPTTASIASNTTASFVWTDLASQSHSFTTSDWNSDALVKNLPTDSQTLTK